MSIQTTLQTLLTELKNTAKSETVFGDPIQAGSTTLIPVSKVSFGFTAAGSGKSDGINGTGGGIQISPIALVAVTEDGNVSVNPISKESRGNTLLHKLLDLSPDVLEQILNSMKKDRS